MKSMLEVIIIAITSLSLVTSCSEESLDQTAPAEASGRDDVTPSRDGSARLNKEALLRLVESGAVAKPMGDCLEQWMGGDLPFAEAEVKQAISIDFQTDDIVFSDSHLSEKPRLVMIDISSKKVDDIRLKLMNPNGWYCLNMSFDSADDIKIEAHCDARVVQAKIEGGTADDFKYKIRCSKASTKTPEKESGAISEGKAPEKEPSTPSKDELAEPSKPAVIEDGEKVANKPTEVPKK